ncbi:MAG: aminotransferase class IV [Verrucomicrobiota bacterium]
MKWELRDVKVWLNGEWLDGEEAMVPVGDQGFLRGEGVFETLLAVRGQVFEAGRHAERMRRGAAVLGFEVMATGEFEGLVSEVVERNGLEGEERVRVRVTATPQTVLITAEVVEGAVGPLRVVRGDFQRWSGSPLAGVKATSYLENVLARRWAVERGAREVLFGNERGEWCEGSWSNVFAVVDGVLMTPPLASGCLPGVTREVVMEVAGELGMEVREEKRSLASLDEVREMFVTSSLRGVCPVVDLDGRELTVGEVTVRLRDELERLIGIV